MFRSNKTERHLQCDMQAEVCGPGVRAENELSPADGTGLKAERVDGGAAGKSWKERERIATIFVLGFMVSFGEGGVAGFPPTCVYAPQCKHMYIHSCSKSPKFHIVLQ